MKHKPISDRLHAYLQLLIGCLLGALAYPLLLTPNAIAPGGLTGAATVIHYMTGGSVGVGVLSLAMNIPVFLWGYKTLGRVYAFRTLIATLLFSLLIDLIPLIVPACVLTRDPLLAVVFGGVLLGAGLGLIFRAGASTCGTDLIAQMLHRSFSFLSVGVILTVLDCCVVLFALFTMSLEAALYSMIEIFICSKVIDLVLTGLGHASACYIITRDPEALARRVIRELDRGATYLHATGAYTGSERTILLTVVSSREVPRLKKMVREMDEKAFLFITDSHETLGEGFSALDEV